MEEPQSCTPGAACVSSVGHSSLLSSSYNVRKLRDLGLRNVLRLDSSHLPRRITFIYFLRRHGQLFFSQRTVSVGKK